MPELNDIINDLPPELATDGSTDDTTDTDLPTGDEGTQGGENEEDTEGADGAGEDEDGQGEEEDDDDNEDYFTNLEEEEDKPAVAPIQPAQAPSAAVTDEGQFILTNLPKISVQLVVPGADGKDEVKQFDVYGWGDLPRNMKGFATPYEQGVFTASANNNELRARELQTQFRQNKAQEDLDIYNKKENKAVADDLSELRREGIFPKFKGVPGTKEFNDSLGAKEFDKVIAYMNEQNDRYGKAANSGRSYRHIGFREAFIMLNGPNLKAAEKKDMEGRRRVAGKLRSSRGTNANDKVLSTKRVTNINELADEFAQFAGNKS